MNCGIGLRCGWYPALLWLWCRLAAIALIRPLAWEPPYAAGAALKNNNNNSNNKMYPSPAVVLHIVPKMLLCIMHALDDA